VGTQEPRAADQNQAHLSKYAKVTTRARDWLCQAKHDLELARLAREAGRHGWACFAAPQGAEKAHLHLGQEAWGPTVAKLQKELPIEVPGQLIEEAKFLDAYYVPTRYPDAFAEGTPAEH